jgi:hypothetical protein
MPTTRSENTQTRKHPTPTGSTKVGTPQKRHSSLKTPAKAPERETQTPPTESKEANKTPPIAKTKLPPTQTTEDTQLASAAKLLEHTIHEIGTRIQNALKHVKSTTECNHQNIMDCLSCMKTTMKETKEAVIATKETTPATNKTWTQAIQGGTITTTSTNNRIREIQQRNQEHKEEHRKEHAKI